jgi:hypothetical protein
MMMKNPETGRAIPIPNERDVPEGTMRNIVDLLGVTVEEFLQLVRGRRRP